MFGKSFVTLGSLVAAGAYFSGSFGSSYERVVGASPEEVRAALADLDIREAPGEPGSDPFASGGVAPLFELSRQGEDMVWTVMSGDKVAIRLTAHLEPVDGGRQTRVTASYERGDAPDDFISPAFRSKGVTLGLFGTVLEDELDDLTRPATADATTCQEIMDDFQNGAPPGHQQTGFAGVSKTALRLHALESKLKAAGCDTGFKKFENVEAQLDGPGAPVLDDGPSSGNSFEPGKPMVDLGGDTASR